MEPERRCKSGMDGGLTAASLVSRPPLYLRTAVFLSNQPGPPYHASDALGYMIAYEFGMRGKFGEMPDLAR